MSRLQILSVAVPVYNEREVLPEFLRRLVAVLDEVPGGPHQIILADDGSTDGSREFIREAVAADERIRAVFLSRNFGHQAALTAALDIVSGDATIVMDADLQDDPSLIPEFLARFEDGYEVVYAVRRTRQEPLRMRLMYRLFYRLAARLSGDSLPVDSGDFGLMSRRVVEAIRRSPERQRYLRGLRAWVGFRQFGLPVDRSERYAGRSKYSRRKLMRLALDGLFAFSVAPLRFAAAVGAMVMGISVLWGLFALYARFFMDQSPRGFTSLIVTIIFLSGTNLLFLGVIGEYVGRIYEESKGRPHYVVDEVIRSVASADKSRE